MLLVLLRMVGTVVDHFKSSFDILGGNTNGEWATLSEETCTSIFIFTLNSDDDDILVAIMIMCRSCLVSHLQDLNRNKKWVGTFREGQSCICDIVLLASFEFLKMDPSMITMHASYLIPSFPPFAII